VPRRFPIIRQWLPIGNSPQDRRERSEHKLEYTGYDIGVGVMEASFDLATTVSHA
jgi:hypothetical protein